MNCKNCDKSLRTDHSFCPDCGAKVIRNRLTFKNLCYDITERYFNVDNTFLKTFWHLFTKPQVVIGGYIEGIRKKYLNPISYLAIALTLSGITLFVMRKTFKKGIDFSKFSGGQNLNSEMGEKLMSTIFDYSSFIFLLYIPVFAFAGWVAFNQRNYNLSEHAVTAMYSLAQYSIVSFPVSILVLLLSPESYFSLTWPMLIFMVTFAIYVVNRLNKLKPMQRITRSLLYIFLWGAGYLGTMLFFYLILFVTGEISLSDFAPK